MNTPKAVMAGETEYAEAELTFNPCPPNVPFMVGSSVGVVEFSVAVAVAIGSVPFWVEVA